MTLANLCFGLGIQNSYNLNNESNTIRCLRTAYEKGITTFDTAESYGDGKSEVLIGKTFKKHRDKINLNTKVSPENLTSKLLEKSLAGSLKRLQTDYLDVYQIHWPNPKSDVEEIFEFFSRNKSQGKIGKIGVCNYNVLDLKEIFLKFPDLEIFSNQIEFSIWQRYAEDSILEFSRENSIEIFSYSPFGTNWQIHEDLKKKLIALTELSGLNSYQLTLNWLIKWRKISPIFSSANVNHISANTEKILEDLGEEIYLSLDKLRLRQVGIEPFRIRVVHDGFNSRPTYINLEEAKLNRLNFFPSPMNLAKRFAVDKEIKPVVLRKVKINYKVDAKQDEKLNQDVAFELVQGRIRFWAWVLAFGWEKKIPAYIINSD